MTTCDRCGEQNPADIHTCTPKRPPNCGTGYCSCIECVMKPAPAQPAPMQEPVAEVKLKTTGGNVGIATVIHEIYSHYREPLQPGDKLYTTPPAAQRQWVGLTPEDVRKINQEVWGYVSADHARMRGYAHAIEAKLQEKNTCQS
jgi:hypothetical protein